MTMGSGIGCTCFPAEESEESKKLINNPIQSAGGALLDAPKKRFCGKVQLLQNSPETDAEQLRRAHDEIVQLHEKLCILTAEAESQAKIIKKLKMEAERERRNSECANKKLTAVQNQQKLKDLRETTSKTETLVNDVKKMLEEKRSLETQLDLFATKFEQLYAVVADHGFEPEFLDEELMEKIFPARPDMNDAAEEYMDDFSRKLRRKLRQELVPKFGLHSSQNLIKSAETVRMMLSRIEKLGISHEDFDVDSLSQTDIIALVDIRDQLEELPVLEGFLEKMSPSKYAGWQKRWVVVRDWVFWWSKKEISVDKSTMTSEQKRKFVNYIPLMLVKAISVDSKDGQFTITAQDRKNGQIRNYTWRVLSNRGSKAREVWTEGLEKYRSHLQLCMQWISMTKSIGSHVSSPRPILNAVQTSETAILFQ